MRRHLVWAVIFLLYVHSLMKSVDACDPTKRKKDRKNHCAGMDCDRGKCKVAGCSSCTGSNPWCAGYCTK
uniref:Putative secreted protein n=1 Tax=Amblyomma americanum TaxID=6943 RepID=A0A0C9SEG9_AMBAM